MSLISAPELARRIADGRVRVADVRWYLNRPGAGREAYATGHIPGAIFIDLDDDLSDTAGFGAPGRHPLPSPGAFERRMGAAGIGSNDLVVAYDDAAGANAARLWWMLDNLGHRGGQAILDGGLQAWLAAGQPLSTEVPKLPPATLKLGDEWHNVISRDDLAGRLGLMDLLDARAGERYRGEVEPIDPAAGHIPTAISAPFTENLGADGRMLTPSELRRRYEPLLIEGRTSVVSCGSGTTACHDALAMRIAGLRDPLLYVGSFSDWSRSDMPVVTGPQPGDPAPTLKG